MTREGAGNDRLNEYVTVGGEIAYAGDVEIGPDQTLKTGTFYRPVADTHRDGSETGRFAILSDEGPALGGSGSAPSPLQYFLAAIAF